MFAAKKLLTSLFGSTPVPRKAKPATRLVMESLEGRDCPSWGAVPPSTLPSGGDAYVVNSTGTDGIYTTYDYINRGEVDSYRFTAQRTGTYTFTVAKVSGSSIDTVMGLYDSSRARLAYNDDASASTTDSKITYSLVAGREYRVALSNYTGSANGRYYLKYTPPAITNSISRSSSSVFQSGNARLNGSTLTMSLTGTLLSSLSYTHHYMQIRIYDRFGATIHTGSYEGSFRTDTLPFGDPSSRTESFSWNVSGLNLERAFRISLVIGNR